VRPKVQRYDFGALISQLNQIEGNRDGRWKLDNSEMTSIVKFLDVNNILAASKLRPDELVSLVQAELYEQVAQTSVCESR
jgi:hypothetical protein